MIDPPGLRHEQHHNQLTYAGVGAETAGGLRGGIVFRRGFLTNFWAGGGRIEVTICDRAGELDRTAHQQHHQHNNQRAYAGSGAGTARGMVWRLRFLKGIFVRKKLLVVNSTIHFRFLAVYQLIMPPKRWHSASPAPCARHTSPSYPLRRESLFLVGCCIINQSLAAV